MNILPKNMVSLFFGVCMAFVARPMVAQDAVYSQYLQSPILLNPAYTGHISGTYRLAVMHRSQWAAVLPSNGYQTPSVVGDFNTGTDNGSNMGLGLAVMSDQIAGGKMSHTSVLLSAAYHLPFDAANKHFFSLGMQGGVRFSRVDAHNLLFESQILGGSGENFTATTAKNTDFTIGGLWSSFFSKRFEWHFGASYGHVVELQERYINDISTVYNRVSIMTDAKYTFRRKPIWLTPSILVVSQGTMSQVVAGSGIGYRFNHTTNIMAGLHYRYLDAVILNFGVEYKRAIKVGISYDVNTSPFFVATKGRGGMEISFVYVGIAARRYQKVNPARHYKSEFIEE